MKDKSISYLVERLNKAGVINNKTIEGGKQTVHYWIRTERLKLRQKPHSKWYVVNKREADSIIKEFSPGGEGYWFWTD